MLLKEREQSRCWLGGGKKITWEERDWTCSFFSSMPAEIETHKQQGGLLEGKLETGFEDRLGLIRLRQ